MKKRIKVMTFVGTRPEIIRLSVTIKLLDQFTEHILVHTGQNYDYELNEIFFKDLELRKPDHFLNVDVSSLGTSIGDIIKNSEIILQRENPDTVLVLGDTNSCLAAYMAKRMHIPVFHMEAGNRCFDLNVPEEINRLIIDHIADFNIVYTEHARRHLIAEGLPQRRIYLCGSPMNEVLSQNKEKINRSDILKKLKLNKNNYLLASIHREENVDNKNNLMNILKILNTISDEYDMPVIVSTHPRTRKRIDSLTEAQLDKRVRFLKPFGFIDYVKLQMNSLCVISDSGTVSEESAILSFPAVTLRQSMERPEALDSGSIILTGFDPDIILNSIRISVEGYNNGSKKIPDEYRINDTSWRVLKLIIGNSKLSNIWWGIND